MLRGDHDGGRTPKKLIGLARMVGLDEGALICDFAETYHVLDWRALPVRTAATLAMGLGPTSRIMRKLSGVKWPFDTLLLAMICDSIRGISWQLVDEKGRRGHNPPVSVLKTILGEEKETTGFDSADDFKSWRASMLEG